MKNQNETNQLILNKKALTKVLSFIPINQRLKLRELNSLFNEVVSQTPLKLNLNQIKDEKFKETEINTFIQKFSHPQSLIFPKTSQIEINQLAKPIDTNYLQKFDAYEIENFPLEYIQWIVANSPNLTSIGFRNNEEDLTETIKLLSNLKIQELKIGKWNQQTRAMCIEQADHLTSLTIEQGDNEMLIELMKLYNEMKQSGINVQDDQPCNKLNLKEIKFRSFQTSPNQQENLNVFKELLNQFELQTFHFGIIEGDIDNSILFCQNFFNSLKGIQELQFGFSEADNLKQVNLQKLKTLKLCGIKFKKEIFMHLMQKSRLFEYIDLRECTFDFALTDTFERIENHEGIVNVYVNTGINDPCSCQLAQFQYNNIWINFIYPFKYDIDEEIDLQKQQKL